MKHRLFLSAVAALSGAAAAAPLSAQHDHPAPFAAAQLDAARRFSLSVAKPIDAHRLGFHRIAHRGIKDLNPFVGEHWINEWNLYGDSLDPARPAYIMFYPVLPDSAPIGFAYGVAQRSGSPPPDGFAGEADVWHVHQTCHDLEALGSALVRSVDDCTALGGRPGSSQIAMVHVWLEPANPDGPFAAFNPALPFVATGLAPPTAEDMASPARASRLRRLGLALGETFGAVPRTGGLVDNPRNAEFRSRVAPHRDSITALLPALRDAERHGDRDRYDALATEMIAQWEAVRAAYLELAGSDAARTLLERWFEAAVLGVDPHGHQP